MAFGAVYYLYDSSPGSVAGVLTIIVATYVCYVVTRWYRKLKPLRQLAAKLPGPRGLPLIGNALEFSCEPEELLDRSMKVIEPYKNVTPVRIWLGPKLHVVVAEPRDIEVILNSQQSACKGLIYQFLQPFIGDGLISGSGRTWRSHRKLVAPMFNARSLEGYVQSFERHSQVLVDKLRSLADGREFDVLSYMSRCTIDGVCESIMGCPDINSQEHPDQEFIHSTEKMYEIIHIRMMKVWLHPDSIFRLSANYQTQQKCQDVIRKFTEKLIATKQRDYAEALAGAIVNNRDGNSILDQLIKQRSQGHNNLTNEELRDEIYTIYIASQDTLALVSSFALLMLGIHEDIQKNVREELADVLRDGNVTSSLLSELKYLEMMIKETLRMFPIAPFMVRTLRNDLTLETCTLPQGCEVVIAALLTHKSDKHWKNPDEFIPERFSAEEVRKRHPYAFIPFSGGLMGCIGQKFAMMSLKTIIAYVVRNYRIHSTVRLDDIKLKSDISIRSVNGYQLSLERL